MVPNISEEVLINIRKITRAIDIHSKKLVQKYGLTGPQLILLKACVNAEKITISSLAEQINLSKPTVTSIVERLLQKGYVSRVKDTSDKRKVFVSPTEKTLLLFDKSPSLLQESFVNRFDKLAEWEKLQILSTLQRIAAMMNADEIASASVLESDIFC